MLWEELTSKDFEKARELSKETCIIPFGVIEKHGQHLPLGTDMLAVREFAVNVAKIEPVVIFPYYYFGQINEARQVPGTISITPQTMYTLLEEVCDEISRNGFKKIIILNGHGGNTQFINYFIQSTLYKRRDYVIYNVPAFVPEEDIPDIIKSIGSNDLGSHAGNLETSMIMAIRPDLVKMDDVETEGIHPYGKLKHIKGVFTSVSWYADHPTHFAGDPYKANPESGKLAYKMCAESTVKYVKLVKEDNAALQLQNEFYSKMENL
jgi:creatinine amidohydrolase